MFFISATSQKGMLNVEQVEFLKLKNKVKQIDFSLAWIDFQTLILVKRP